MKKAIDVLLENRRDVRVAVTRFPNFIDVELRFDNRIVKIHLSDNILTMRIGSGARRVISDNACETDLAIIILAYGIILENCNIECAVEILKFRKRGGKKYYERIRKYF